MRHWPCGPPCARPATSPVAITARSGPTSSFAGADEVVAARYVEPHEPDTLYSLVRANGREVRVEPLDLGGVTLPDPPRHLPD